MPEEIKFNENDIIVVEDDGYRLSLDEKAATQVYNGLRSMVKHSIQPTDIYDLAEVSKKSFWKKMDEDFAFKRIYRANDVKVADDPRWRILGTALVDIVINSYDACIDKMKERGNFIFDSMITTEVYTDGNEVVINIIDNGKTIEFRDGSPVTRDRGSVEYMGGKGTGVDFIKKQIGQMGGRVKWYPLKAGTKTEVRIPKNNMPSEFSIKGSERVVVENEPLTMPDESENPSQALWAFEMLNRFVAQALELQISKHTLKDLLVNYIGEDFLGGFDLENIEEVRDGKERIKEFSLIFETGSTDKYKLLYSFENGETTKIIIPISDNDNVYMCKDQIETQEPLDLSDPENEDLLRVLVFLGSNGHGVAKVADVLNWLPAIPGRLFIVSEDLKKKMPKGTEYEKVIKFIGGIEDVEDVMLSIYKECRAKENSEYTRKKYCYGRKTL